MPRTCHLAHYHCHTGMPASVGAKRDAEMRLGFLQTWLNTTETGPPYESDFEKHQVVGSGDAN